MARSTTTIANTKDDSYLIDPLIKLREQRNPRTAFGGTIGGRTFYELMRDPSVSFTEVKEEEEEVIDQPISSSPPIDPVATGNQRQPIEVEIDERTSLEPTVEALFDKEAVEDQQLRESLSSIYVRAAELNDNDIPAEYKNNASGASLNSLSEKTKDYSSDAIGGLQQRSRNVINFINDPRNRDDKADGSGFIVSGLTPNMPDYSAKVAEKQDLKSIDPQLRVNSFKNRGGLGPVLHSLDSVQEVNLGRKTSFYNRQTEEMGPLEEAYDLIPDNVFTRISAIIAEEYFAGTLNSSDMIPYDKPTPNNTDDNPRVFIEQQNEILGNEIIKAVRQAKGQDPDQEILKEEATVIGDFAKNLYQRANPELVERHDGNYSEHKRAYFQLTPRGAKELNDPNLVSYRRALIDRSKIRVRKNRNIKSIHENKISGRRKKAKFSKSSDEALRNLDNMPIVIDNRRFSILLQTAIGFLLTRPDLKNYLDSYLRLDDSERWKLDILGIGSMKIVDLETKYKLAENANKKKRYRNEPIVQQPELIEHLRIEYDKAVYSLMKDLKGLSVELGGVFYFDHGRQGYSGRIQNINHDLNYLASKIVRVMIRSPNKYAVKKGSRSEAVLRQMYAMILTDTNATSINEILLTYDRSIGTINQRINMRERAVFNRRNIKGSEALPMVREKLLDLYSDKLEGWGDRLKEVYLSDPQSVQKITNRFSEEVKKEDVNLPTIIERTADAPIPNANLDPEKDAELIEVIAGKLTDGLLFIEGLIEFSDYIKWKRTKTDKPFYGSFNTHTDAKTSGSAILSQFLGNQDVAFLTGTVRYNNYTLTDNGDIRDKLAYVLKTNMNTIDSQEIYKGTSFKEITGGVTNQTIPDLLDTIGNVIFTDRELNKSSMMTIPYGVEFNTLRAKIEEAIRRAYAQRNDVLGDLYKGEPINVWYGENQNSKFSNLAARPFTYQGRNFTTVEHAYQTFKSGKFDVDTYNKSWGEGKKFTGKLGTKTDEDWNINLMKDLIFYSFLDSRNSKVARDLVLTGGTDITHNQDKGIWKTKFPEVLMDVRSKLRDDPRFKTTRDNDDFFSRSVDLLENSGNFEQAVTALHKVYIEHGVSQVIDPFVLEYKSIMRSMTKLSQAMNSLIPIQSADGSHLVLSRKSPAGVDPNTPAKQYQISNKRYTVNNYLVEEDMVGTKENIDPKTGFNQAFIGDDDFNTGIAMMVLGGDASIISKTLSGDSYKRLKKSLGETVHNYSTGKEEYDALSNAYHPVIMDAIMADIGSYDTVTRESNIHFTNLINQYNIGKEVSKSIKKTYKDFMDSLNYVQSIVTDSQSKNEPLQKRSNSDLLSDREKAFIVDLLSYNSQYNVDKKTGDVTNPLAGDPILFKFKNESQFEAHRDGLYFSQKISYKDNTFTEFSGLRTDVIDEIYELQVSNGRFDVMNENYKKSVDNLDVAFLKNFLKLYSSFLFGKNFKRLDMFTEEIERRKRKLKSLIDENGYPVWLENGKLKMISLNYFGS